MQTKGRRVLSSSRATWRPISPPPQTMMWSRNAAICRSILRFSHRCERSPSTQNAVSAPIAYRTIARPTTISPIVNQRPARVRGWTESKLTEETVTTVM